MTTRIEELLSQDAGIHRRVYLMIDGVEPIFWQYSDKAIPTYGYDRSGIECLDPPEVEWSNGLALDSMTVDPSAVTVKLKNVKDPDDETAWYFSKLFAPGRWARSNSKYALVAIEDPDTDFDDAILASDAIEIFVDRDLSSWDVSGIAYLGSEAFSYGGVASVGGSPTAKYKFTGVQRGIYPCIGDGFAQTFRLTKSDEQPGVDGIVASSVPMSMLGRRMALYVTAWDPYLGRYLGHDDSLLIWTGRINNEISFAPAEQNWVISGESCLKDLEKKVVKNLPESAFAGVRQEGFQVLYGFINLQGARGRTFRLECWPTWDVDGSGDLYDTEIAYTYITVDEGEYTNCSALADEINKKIADTFNVTLGVTELDFTYWTKVDSSAPTPTAINGVPWFGGGGSNKFVFTSDWTDQGLASVVKKATWKIRPWDGQFPCHALIALGFKPWEPFECTLDIESDSPTEKTADDQPAHAYHPLSPACNGGKMTLSRDALENWWRDQGDSDDATDYSYLMVEDAILQSGGSEIKGNYIVAFDDISEHSRYEWMAEIDLASNNTFSFEYKYGFDSYVVHRRETEEAPRAKLIYGVNTRSSQITLETERGPFEMLLYPMLSTGSQSGYNDATYDRMPVELSAGIDSSIVDVDSFLRADAYALTIAPDLAKRAYPIFESISLKDMLSRECQLFGHFLAWDRGKIRLKPAFQHSDDSALDSIDNGTNAELIEYPNATLSAGTVINHWSIMTYNHANKKTRKVEVSDMNSISALVETKTVEIDHPGLAANRLSVDNLTQMLRTLLFEKREMMRFPWYVVRTTLKPSMINKVQIGDIVRFQSETFPDPYGFGGFDVDAKGIVLDRTQSLSDYTGTAMVLLYSIYEASLKHAIGAAAAIDHSAANGGWDNVNKRLTLVSKEFDGDYASDEPDDGARFYALDKINIIERAPSDPTSPTTWTNVTVLSDYETDGAELLTLAPGTTLTAFDTTGNTKYIIVAADVDNVPAAQAQRNTFLAEDASKELDGEFANRYS